MLSVSGGRLAWNGYGIEVSESGFRPRLRLDTPTAVIHDGPEPGRRWTEQGAIFALAGPPVLLALVLAFGLTQLGRPALLPVAAILAVAVLAWLFVAIRWRFEPEALERAIDAGWLLLAPRLHEPTFARTDLLFLAGLAQASVQRGQPLLRGPALRRALLLAEQAGDVPPRPLAALARLAVEDGAWIGGDPALLASQAIAPVFRGAAPLAFAEHLSAALPASSWSPSQRARLRVLACAAAFEAGLSIHDLVEIAARAPTLGDLLDLHDLNTLAPLRLVWELRASRPWARCGEAFTVFELAGHARLIGRQLNQVPDLLLWQAGPETDLDEPPSSMGIAGRGVLFANRVFTELPVPIAVLPEGAGHLLQAGADQFWYRHDPERAAQRLCDWSDWYFRDFQPQARALLTRPPMTPVRFCERCQRVLGVQAK